MDDDAIVIRMPVSHYKKYCKSIIASYVSILGPINFEYDIEDDPEYVEKYGSMYVISITKKPWHESKNKYTGKPDKKTNANDDGGDDDFDDDES